MNKDTVTIFVMALNTGAVVQPGMDAVNAFKEAGGTGQNNPDNPRPGYITGPSNDETQYSAKNNPGQSNRCECEALHFISIALVGMCLRKHVLAYCPAQNCEFELDNLFKGILSFEASRVFS